MPSHIHVTDYRNGTFRIVVDGGGDAHLADFCRRKGWHSDPRAYVEYGQGTAVREGAISAGCAFLARYLKGAPIITQAS